MRVVTTNLAMRFYKSDGWTREILSGLVKEGSIDPRFKFFADDRLPYWIPEVGTQLDIDRLLKITTSVQRTFNGYPNQTDKEHLESKNW